MEGKSIKKNYLYNLVYQILILILPLITTPYISRVLGPTNVGIYSFTVTIVTYFTLFGALGVSLYGQREIAYARENKRQRKKAFFEIIVFRTITMAISTCIYIFAYVNGSQYQEYYRILILYLIAATFDISWFFQGIEEFKKTVTRNVAVRIISVACIFIFVKKPEDLSKYLLIYALADLVGNLSLWFYLPKYFNGVKIGKFSAFRHAVPIIMLFIPQIAIKVYNIIDKTMIGYMIADKAVLGNYEEAHKVINVLFTIVSSLGIVMVPRIASIYASGDKKTLNSYIVRSFRFMFFLAYPITFGIDVVAKEFVPIFLGTNFTQTANIIYILSPIVIGTGITNVIGVQYLLPTKRQKEYTISAIAGLITNVVLNFIIIPFWGGIGAALTTTVAQFVLVGVQIYYVRNELPIKKAFISGKKYFIASIVMFLCCLLTGVIIKTGILSILIKIIVGAIAYLFMLIVLGDKYVYDIRDFFINRAKSKRGRKEKK